MLRFCEHLEKKMKFGNGAHFWKEQEGAERNTTGRNSNEAPGRGRCSRNNKEQKLRKGGLLACLAERFNGDEQGLRSRVRIWMVGSSGQKSGVGESVERRGC